MIRRIYVCTDESCNHTYEIYQSMSEGIDRVCPECKQETLFQDLVGIYGSNSEPRTVGALAEKNAAKLGKAGIERMEYQSEQAIQKKKSAEREQMLKVCPDIKFIDKKKETPWFGELPKDVKKSINSKTGEDKNKRIAKYINEGK